jgi:hypothetical protein
MKSSGFGFFGRAGKRNAYGGQPTPSFCYEFADWLRRILESRRPQILINQSGRKVWASAFRRLWKALGEQHIRKFLTNYEKQINRVREPLVTGPHDLLNPRIFNWLEELLGEDGWRKTDVNGDGPWNRISLDEMC